MLAPRITLLHLSVSAVISLPKSAAESSSGSPPSSKSRVLILGSARATLISLLSLSIISMGVFLGATMPSQPLASYPGIVSPIVGTSGKPGGGGLWKPDHRQARLVRLRWQQ